MIKNLLKYRNKGVYMSLKQIECVVMVAKLKSFTKAAHKLKIAQPSLSQSINILEKQIGVPLFDRSTTPISLTHAGEIYLSKANAIIDLYNDLNVQMRDVTGFENGKLRLGITQTGYHFIQDALSTFYKKFPNTDLNITQVFSTLNLKKMLLDGDIDIGTLILPLNTEELKYKIIKEEQVCLALPITHPLAQKTKKKATSWKGLRCLIGLGSDNTYHENQEHFGRGVRLHRRHGISECGHYQCQRHRAGPRCQGGHDGVSRYR
jgi:DNA-binding transcriptional LysR family regulator